MLSMKVNNLVIRKAELQDVPLLLEFIKGIARYEKMENEVIASDFCCTFAMPLMIFACLETQH